MCLCVVRVRVWFQVWIRHQRVRSVRAPYFYVGFTYLACIGMWLLFYVKNSTTPLSLYYRLTLVKFPFGSFGHGGGARCRGARGAGPRGPHTVPPRARHRQGCARHPAKGPAGGYGDSLSRI